MRAVSCLLALLVVGSISSSTALAQTADELGAPPQGSTFTGGAPEAPPSADEPIPEPPTGDTRDEDEGEAREGFPEPRSSVALSETDGFRMPPQLATRLRVLDTDFTALSSRGGNALVDGILSIVTGGLGVALGFLVDNDLLSTYFFLYGGAGIVRGVVDIALSPDAETPAIQFAHMPMSTMAEVRTRLRYGERELESLADDTRLVRVLDASLNIGVGVAIVPLYLGPKLSDETPYEPSFFDYFVFIGAGISVISGVVNLLSESEAERRWDAYVELRDRLENGTSDEDEEDVESDEVAERPSFPSQTHLSAGPLPGGGGAVVLRRTF